MQSHTGRMKSPRDHAETDPTASDAGIKLRIFIPLILAVAVLLGSFIFALRHDQNRTSELEIRRTAGDLQKLLHAEQQDDAALMATTIQAIMNDERMAQAFRVGDREALRLRTAPLLETLRTQHRITHLYFHGPDRVNLLRAHHPEQHGDLVNRFTLLEAERTGQMASGLERGPIGRFVLRVVVPWRDGGQLLGYLELGMEFQDVIREMRGVLDVDVVATIQKKYLDQAQWDTALQARGQQGTWDQFPDHVVIDQTMRGLPEPIARLLASNRLPPVGIPSEVSWNGREALLVLLRLEDAGGKGYGDLFVLRDVTAAAVQARRSIWLVSVVCVALSALLLGIFYVFLGRIQRRLVEKTARLSSEIMERRLAEQAARESESKFLQLAENITDAFWIRSPDLREVHYVSPGFERIWGRPVEDLYGNPAQWTEFIFPEDREAAAEAFAGLAQDVAQLDIEYRIVRPDGEIRWVRVRGFQVRDAEGKLVRLTGIAGDITERKHAVDQLRKEREMLAALVENVTDAIVSCDADGVLTLFNRATRELHGLPGEAIPAEQWAEHFDLYLPDGETRMPKEQIPLFRALQEGSVHDAEMVIAPKGGTPRRVSSRGQAFYDAAGRKMGAVVAMQDITARKQAEEELLRSRKVLAGVLNQIPQRVFWKDRDLIYRGCNRAFAADMGFREPGEVIGRTDFDATWKDVAALYRADDRRGHGVERGEDEFRRARHRGRWERGVAAHEQNAAARCRWKRDRRARHLRGRDGTQTRETGDRTAQCAPRTTHRGAHRRARRRHAGSRKREQRQERVPFPHEPRAAHADERDPRLRASARDRTRFERGSAR